MDRSRRTCLTLVVALLVAGPAGAAAPTDAAAPPPLGVFELRHYQTTPGRRDALIAMFETRFQDPQETMGSHVIGSFRDLDAPDSWVWIRAFADLAARARARDTFYSHPVVWKPHAAAANALIVDAGNVLLLEPATGQLWRDPTLRPPVGTVEAPDSLFELVVYRLPEGQDRAFAGFHATELVPVLEALGAPPLATFTTGRGGRDYPTHWFLDETVFVAITRFDSTAAHAAFVERRARSDPWRALQASIAAKLRAPVEYLRLRPTARSSLR